MKQRQRLVQQQRLALNQQLVQGFSLIKLSSNDLREEVLKQVESNPALTIVSDPLRKEGETAAAESIRKLQNQPSVLRYTSEAEGKLASDNFQNFLENRAEEQRETIRDVLNEQLLYQKKDPDILTTARILVQDLDLQGFFILPPERFIQSAPEELKSVLQKNLTAAISLLQKLEPQGCAVFNFKESLAVQAELRFSGFSDPLYDYTIRLLKNHSELLFSSEKDLQRKLTPSVLSKRINEAKIFPRPIDAEDAEDILSLIQELHPYPGRSVLEEQPPESDSFFAPDVIVKKTDTGFTAEINNQTIPVIAIREDYAKNLSGAQNKNKSAAKEQLRDAQTLIDLLAYRDQTLLKITEALLNFQQDFFRYGPAKHSPLRMLDVAEAVGIHVSTVSRAVNNKYLQYEHKNYPLRYFFSSRLMSVAEAKSGIKKTYTSSQYSKESVKHRIKKIVEQWRKNNPNKKISDQTVSDILKQEGIQCARRTVNKYRTELRTEPAF
ncbi:RNA polymerase factor sigma-54 [Treponema phagedenis]|uniref:RNA polymerase factor sigma-54 n=1 Tax=Treponema phagedenis TaxID=162 RepID=A0AAE6IV51_TREPH|nr:RNA polymerase factor sigma-54 [Treponema phagedenis]QEJ98763.1 RNA polymerase factor sigma-54 [Treponema phagedenis]QEK01579.1 RNA polymerase factor sigma-54 [Treponema phagedenis]QEK04268.1 RNA polymerase factor sigma-54 [Treponema phagedenis]QEK06665.1 RNA polymerase factor sigma-54 [Treponema phagedenis]QEK09922.1 RNA polymerase factor sigma-54 [Treponema phagedenis]